MSEMKTYSFSIQHRFVTVQENSITRQVGLSIELLKKIALN